MVFTALIASAPASRAVSAIRAMSGSTGDSFAISGSLVRLRHSDTMRCTHAGSAPNSIPPAEVLGHDRLSSSASHPSFSHATASGNLIFVSGTLGTEPGGLKLVAGGVKEQTAQALRNIEKILSTQKASLADVAKCTVFLRDMEDFAAMNEAYIPFFKGSPPARSTIAAAGLAFDARVEIECIAALPH